MYHMNRCHVTFTQADLLPPSLQEILLRSCGIASITCISGDTSQRDVLPCLRTLNLSQNYLKALPPCMLPSCLVTLDVCGNFLAELPPHLESLADFWNLFVNDNKLTSLPAWILELHSLRRLSFSGNPIPPSLEQRQLAASVQMSINLRTLARQGASSYLLRSSRMQAAVLLRILTRVCFVCRRQSRCSGC
jgi:hypothetical protein